MNKKNAGVLVDILAKVDAVYRPVRHWGGNTARNVYFARVAYEQEGGIGMRSSGGLTEASRKSNQRGLETIAEEGLVELCRPGDRTKLLGVRLTDRGEAETRALCGLPSLAVAMVALRQLASFGREGWVSEEMMAGRPCWGHPDATHELLAVESMLAPAILRKWVDGNSDAKGRVFYRLAPAGVAILASTMDDVEATADHEDTAFSRRARAFYDRRRTAALLALASGEPRNANEIGAIPLPDGCPDGVTLRSVKR